MSEVNTNMEQEIEVLKKKYIEKLREKPDKELMITLIMEVREMNLTLDSMKRNMENDSLRWLFKHD